MSTLPQFPNSYWNEGIARKRFDHLKKVMKQQMCVLSVV